MKLIFTHPRMREGFPSFWLGAAFKGYLQYHDVFIGDEGIDFTIAWNPVYGFYDISLFEIPGNRSGRAEHIAAALSILRAEADVEQVLETWRWNGPVQIRGKRIWIKAVEVRK